MSSVKFAGISFEGDDPREFYHWDPTRYDIIVWDEFKMKRYIQNVERFNKCIGGENAGLDVKCVQGVGINLTQLGIPIVFMLNDYQNDLEKQPLAFTNRFNEGKHIYKERIDKQKNGRMHDKKQFTLGPRLIIGFSLIITIGESVLVRILL